MSYECILTSTHEESVGVITLNRPKQLNALNDQLMDELGAALTEFDKNKEIGCIVITGSEKAFAAGADIAAMADKTFESCLSENFISKNWEHILKIRKPVIAAVNGFALGGGCELAMMCDFIISSDTAKFGQPEIKLGVSPGGGGTQRLPKAISKSKAMDMLLTGRMMDANEAERAGLVSRIIPAPELMSETLKIAKEISNFGTLATIAIKECVNQAYESGLTQGVAYERRTFHALFSTQDQKEGMKAFLEKRPAKFVKN